MANTSNKRNRPNKPSKYEELEHIKAELGEQTRRLRLQLGDTEEAFNAVTLAIRVWKNRGATAVSKVALNPRLREFQGLTQVQALVKIAKENGNNRFRIREAKKLLLEAGLVKSKKNANTILYTAIQRSGKFKRVAPGEYELIPESEQMISEVMAGKPAKVIVDRFLRSA